MTREAITLARALSDWSGNLRLRRRAASTQTEYAHTGRLLEDRFGRDCDPASITLADLEGLVGSWERLSANTVRVRISALMTFFAYCEERYSARWDVAWRNPTRLLVRPDKEEPALRRLTGHEVAAILAAPLPIRERIVNHTLVYTGLRRSEFRDRTWGDVDVIAGTLTVVLGKGRKGRVIPLAPQLVEVLAWAKASRPPEFVVDDAFLLPRREGHRYGQESFQEYPLEQAGEHSYERAIKDAARIAGVRRPDEITGHMYRRHLAEHLLDRSVSPYVVAAMLGHASIQTTAGYGGGASLQAVRGAITGLVFTEATPGPLARPLSSTHPVQPAKGRDRRNAADPAQRGRPGRSHIRWMTC